jgi:hypothetical protein
LGSDGSLVAEFLHESGDLGNLVNRRFRKQAMAHGVRKIIAKPTQVVLQALGTQLIFQITQQ